MFSSHITFLYGVDLPRLRNIPLVPAILANRHGAVVVRSFCNRFALPEYPGNDFKRQGNDPPNQIEQAEEQEHEETPVRGFRGRRSQLACDTYFYTIAFRAFHVHLLVNVFGQRHHRAMPLAQID
jgi:hypothetical protein